MLARFLGILFALFTLSGCLWLPLLQNAPQTNYALLARSSDPLMNDGSYETIGVTPEGKPRVVVFQFPEMIQIHKIVIYNDNLFRFDLDVWDKDRMEWRTIQTVRQRRDVADQMQTAQAKYTFPSLRARTDKLRLTVSRTVDDDVIPKATAGPEDKVLDIKHSPSYLLGYYYRVLVEAPAKIREIQVFGSPVSP